MKAPRAIIARGVPVDLPRSLTVLPAYPTLTDQDERSLALPSRQRPRALPAVPDLRKLRDAEDAKTPEQPPIAEMVERYLAWKAGNAAKHTVRTYTEGLRLFSEWLTMGGIDVFAETAEVLPVAVMDEYIVWVRQRPSKRSGRALAPSSVVLYHAAVVDLLKYAARRKWLPERFKWAEMKANATETLGKFVKQPAHHDRRVPLLVAYVDALPMPVPGVPARTCSANCHDSWMGRPCTHPPRDTSRMEQNRMALLRDQALLHMFLSTGVRREEVLTLNRADVEDGHATSAWITGKGAKGRTIFWDAETQRALKRYLDARTDPYPPVFIRFDNWRGQPGADGERWRVSPQSAWDIVKRYSAETGIPATPHMFRHAMASAMLENDAPLSLIQEPLGHSSPTVTRQVYAAYEQRSLRRGFDKYNPTASEQVARLQAEQKRRRGAE